MVSLNRTVFFCLLAFVIAYTLSRALKRVALHVGLVDAPGGRKRHEGNIPLIGGVAMFCGFAVSTLASGELVKIYLSLLTALGVLVVVGLLDDLHDVRPGWKIVAQIVAALFMTSWAGVYVSQLGNLLGFGPVNLYGWAIPFTVVCVLGIINAINMADGVDGLAGGLSLVGLAFFGVSALVLGLHAVAIPVLIMMAAVAGFLLLNMRFPWQPRAQVFMGDSGSMMLGLFLTWFSVQIAQGEAPHLPPITAVWFLAVPVMDMGLVTVRRIVKGRDPLKAGRDHVHHVLLHAGFSPAQTVGLMLLASLLFAMAGFVAWRMGVPDWVMFCAFMGLFALYYGLSRRAWRIVRFLKRFRSADVG
jgi:UDP-GlcNAc:undecaprenyl-phosphate/decaprenyl-phosphate GlcNAc-1-phosphate transferase